MFHKKSILLLLCSLLTPHQAWSQTEDDTKLPITIEADRLETQDQLGLSTYSGNVQVTQGRLTLTGNKLEILHPQRQIERVQVQGGPARFKRFDPNEQSWINGQAKTIIYHAQTKHIELIGDAALVQENAHTIQGPILKYDMVKQTLQAGSNDQQTGRVSVTLTPKEADKE